MGSFLNDQAIYCLIHFYKRTDDDNSFYRNIFLNELEEITFLVEVPLQLFKPNMEMHV